ncbi:MAG: hypothetical protein KGL74_02145 [Elusimicrobia bacterium]|nr:hypothetical protein [Elusimicrobiota bacterium]
MKMLLALIAICAVGWFLMSKAEKNAAVRQAQQAPEKYVNALQNDVTHAKAVSDAAAQAVQNGAADVQKAVDAK